MTGNCAYVLSERKIQVSLRRECKHIFKKHLPHIIYENMKDVLITNIQTNVASSVTATLLDTGNNPVLFS